MRKPREAGRFADGGQIRFGPKHLKKAEKKMSSARKASSLFAVAMLVVLGCCCVAFAASEESRSQYAPEATMLDGQVDISGMTADELRAPARQARRRRHRYDDHLGGG